MDPLAPKNLVLGWLAATVALPLTVVAAAAGQGLGAMAGRCAWIGVALPIHRQPWALVNEPSLSFASTPGAALYWLGSLIVPALLAVGVIPFMPRSKTVWAEIAAAQIAFGMAAGGLGWLPLLDPAEGHLARWLHLHHLPSFLLAAAPVLGAMAALPAVFRLLAFDRAAHRAPGPFHRMAVALLSFLPPTALWVGLGTLAAGEPQLLSTFGVTLPLVLALAISAIFSVGAWVLPREPNRRGTPVLLLLAAILLGALVYMGGRPLPGGRASAILWSRPNAYNNIRPWIVPLKLYREPTPPPEESTSHEDLISSSGTPTP